MNRERWFHMSRRWLIVAGLVTVLATLGCSSGGGGSKPTTPVTPAPTGDGNDFIPQSLGTLGASDIVTHGDEADDADVDLYSVTVTHTTNLFFSLDWTGNADLGMALSNNSGITVRNVDTDSKPEQCILGAMPAGTYIVRVSSRTATATPYTLTIGAR
jgi:Bacterial pre-peptidase C-terminal domain